MLKHRNSYKLILSLLVLLILSRSAQARKKEENRPNIIMFLVDDLGWQDTSVPFWSKKTTFNKRYKTPAMERLASQGMKFTQAYASAICSPSRVSLMTGMNAARHRVTNWTLYRNRPVDAKSEKLDFPKWNVNGVQPADSIENSVEATLLPQILKDNGYYTIHCGKAHFGAIGTPAANPLNCGFDVNIAGHAAGGLGSYYGTENFGNKNKGEHSLPWGVPGLEKYHGDSINVTDVLTLEAKKALDSAVNVNQPFYLYMSHYGVHIPISADNRFYKKYLDAGLPEPEAKYASMIEGVDKSLSDLMDYLEDKGIDDNTIILFMSDNGGYSLGQRHGEWHVHNKPLNSGKGSAYEGGIREPMIVKWPNKVKPDTECNDYLIIEDFFPSILEMAGVGNYPTKQKIDGKSFVPMLLNKGTTAKNRNLYWHVPNNWGVSGPGMGPSSTIRSQEWKLIYYYETQSFDLFNIKEDIGELNNLADDFPDKTKDLAIKLGRYLKEVKAQRPSFKNTGKLVPFPDELWDFKNK